MEDLCERNEYYVEKEEMLKFMKDKDMPRSIIDHQLAVCRKAYQIAKEITGEKIDFYVLQIGALTHDIGRLTTHSMDHGIQGALILEKLEMDKEICRIAETHLMGGLSRQDADDLGLSKVDDFMPKTIEEKVVCLADKYCSGKNEITIEERFKRWMQRHGETELLKEQLESALNLELEILRMIFN